MTSSISNSEVRGKTYSTMQPFTEKSILGQDDFLKILITQLRNQDPMEPMQDRDFIAQMATFSSLEQMTSMNKTMQEMRGIMLGQATSYVGKSIQYETSHYDPETKMFIGKEQHSGVVVAVENENGKTFLVTSIGHRVTFDAIQSVAAEERNPITENAHLIGKIVSYALHNADGSMQHISSLVTAVSFLDGKVQLILENNEKISLTEVLKVENA